MAKRKSGNIGVMDDLFSFVPGDDKSDFHGENAFYANTDEDREAYMEAGKAGRLAYIEVDKLKDDPDNKGIYGEYLVEGLTESIKEHGFNNAIRAYKDPKHKGMYIIESGHRSREAAKEAGLEKVPVIVTDHPTDDIERRKRLVLANLHGRRYTPMVIAKEASYLKETYELENKKLEEQGKPPQKDYLNKIAADLEVSIPMVSRYLRLTNLTASLQEIIEEENYSWTMLSEAATLGEKGQDALAAEIRRQERVFGYGSVTKTWLKERIDMYKHILDYESDPTGRNVTDLEKEFLKDEKGKRKRRMDGAKAVSKSLALLKSGLSTDAYIKPKMRDQTLDELKEIRSLIDAKILLMENG